MNHSHYLTLPNALSGMRLLIAPLMVWMLLSGWFAVALVLFIVAVASDLADGYLARTLGQVTRLGRVLDHSADAVLVCGICSVYAYFGSLPVLLPLLIGFSFVQYVLDSEVLRGAQLRVSRLGRVNGIGYFVVAGMALVHSLLAMPWLGFLITAVAWALVLSSLMSMALRLRK